LTEQEAQKYDSSVSGRPWDSIQDDPMATADIATNQAEDKEKLRDEWLERLAQLVATVRVWAQELDWSTRQIETKLEDSQLGTYKASALLLQKETVRVLLEPIAHAAPGVTGIVDFYLMPAYDDIARLFFRDDGWQLHFMFPGLPTVVTDVRVDETRPLSKERFQSVLEAMTRNAE
jgi:hypothetical protein